MTDKKDENGAVRVDKYNITVLESTEKEVLDLFSDANEISVVHHLPAKLYGVHPVKAEFIRLYSRKEARDKNKVLKENVYSREVVVADAMTLIRAELLSNLK